MISRGYQEQVDDTRITDSNGRIIILDGTGDCAEFWRQFDRSCQRKGLGGIIRRENFDEPVKPDDAFARVINNVPNERDHGNIEAYNKTNASYLTKCEQVLELLKGALS